MGFFEVIQKMIRAFTAIPERIGSAGEAVGDIGLGIVDGIIGVIQSAFAGMSGILRAGWDIIAMIFRYINCIIAFFVNLPYCFISHCIVVTIYMFYYLFIVFPVIAIRILTGIDLNQPLEQLISALEIGDEILFEATGISLTRMPPKIVNRCYKCSGKILTFNDVYDDLSIFTIIGNRLSHVFNVKIPGYMKYAKDDFNSARDNFKRVIAPL